MPLIRSLLFCNIYVNKVTRPVKLWCFLGLNASASITFARTWVVFAERGIYSFNIHTSLVTSRRSYLSDHDTNPISWMGAIRTKCTGSPAPFSPPRPRSAHFASRFSFRPAPLNSPTTGYKVSIETAVENFYRINNSCHPIRVEWFPYKSMKILKFSNCREIFPLSITVLKFMSSFVLRCGQQC